MSQAFTIAGAARAEILRSFGLEKIALTPGVLGGALGGLGAGIEAYRSFWDAPTDATLKSRLGRAGLGLLRGGAVGGAVGYGAGHVFKKYTPEAVRNYQAWKPFSGAGDLTSPLSNAKAGWGDAITRAGIPLSAGTFGSLNLLPGPERMQQGANTAWGLWAHPALRALSGVTAGYQGAAYVKDKVDDWRIKQYAAQRMSADHPEVLNPGDVGFAMAGRHVGDYQSSKD